jgi:hypothetical protein
MRTVLLLLLLALISCQKTNEIKYINDDENKIILKDALIDFFQQVFDILNNNGLDIDQSISDIGNLWNNMSEEEQKEIIHAGADGIEKACALVLAKHPIGLAVCGVITTIIGLF